MGELHVGHAGPPAARRSGKPSAWSSTTGNSPGCGRLTGGDHRDRLRVQRRLRLPERRRSTNLTGTPDYAPRIRIIGDPGLGMSSDLYRQFNTAAFQGPLTGSDGLESPAGYLRGCFPSALDLAIARNIRLGGSRNIQLRVDMFNAPNEGLVTARNTTMNLTSPADPTTITNLPYLPDGSIDPARVRPSNSGFAAGHCLAGPAHCTGADSVPVLGCTRHG